MSPAGPRPLSELVADQRIIICAGPGGVGKTTTAAAVALHAARRGRRAVVVTIDPAKRLADALGLGDLTNEPRRVEASWEGPGELWALMLDVKTTFDEVVTRYASDPSQAAAILDNRLYRNISGALSGTQEYMALEKLYDLSEQDRFDLIVVDTPPTRHALDFLDAPARLTRFLDNRFFRLLMGPTRLGLRAVNMAAQAVLRTMSKVVGGDVVRDAISFFTVFEGMEQGFRDRSVRVGALLAERSTSFVVVSAPRRDAVDESLFFIDRLVNSDQQVDAVVVNRLFPRVGPVPAVRTDDHLLSALMANIADLDEIARREQHWVGVLRSRVPGAATSLVPLLDNDVHDLDGLSEVARHLFNDATGPKSAP